MKKIISTLVLLSSLNISMADTYTDEETWVNLNAFIKLNENWQGYLEYQPRFFDYSKYHAVTLHRVAIGRNLGNGFSGWLGYGMITTNDRKFSKFPSKNSHEDRPFLQVMHNHDHENWKFTNRTRYEYRYFRHEKEGAERLRHNLRIQYKFDDSPWAMAVWDEYFWNTNLKAGFDQNRAFIGAAYFFGENQKHMVESGYMNNFVNGVTRDRNAHVWMTTITGRF